MQNSRKFLLLEAVDLVRKSNEIVSSLCTGPKKNFPDRTDHEKAILKDLHDKLRDILCSERVGTENIRSIGDYNNSIGKIHLRKISGSLQSFGQTNEMNETFLETYEALYLLEMNRLIVYYNSVVVSLEQAYEIFLNNKEGDLSLEEYFVFSTLNKVGYILKKFNPNTIYNQEKDNVDTPEDCTRSKRKNMEIEAGSSKKLKSDLSLQSHSEESIIKDLIDQSIYEESIEEKCRNIFASLNVIKLSSGEVLLAKKKKRNTALQYNFDLYNPRKIYKKSHPPYPDYRISLLRFNQNCPDRDELLELYNSHEIKCPIIAVYIDNHLKMTGFIYKFS
ncbi:tRNA-splicing endonuclease subunit Sen54 [Phlebotomus papatasi]|uniref:tRNA-splicing endonuclease subunit Sen54 n=1 Tax=Phlebotomus papatasi TaxID=29031 RepID=UPI002483E16D|nr:tRNA-splicing endonuclease subunit Sen54 [Phlebotomus papatasi]